MRTWVMMFVVDGQHIQMVSEEENDLILKDAQSIGPLLRFLKRRPGLLSFSILETKEIVEDVVAGVQTVVIVNVAIVRILIVDHMAKIVKELPVVTR